MAEKILAVCGPTASGKTSLSIRLAQRLGGEIVSMDSMQVYRGMRIGTAAPTVEEMQGIPHHLIGFVEPDAPFSCADYVTLAASCIRDITARGKLPILCGGTGLYLDSLLRVSAFSDAEGSQTVRASMHEFAEKQGTQALHDRLAAVDPIAAAAIHPNNVRRVVRALEIYETTGVTKTEWDRRSLAAEPKYDARIFVMDFHNRDLLYDRIDRRVDLMMQDGLEAEVRTLWEDGLLDARYIAAQAIGYKEFLPYFEGEGTLSDVTAQISLSTRHYAKRQLTWFRRYRDALWLYPDTDGDSCAPLKTAEELSSEAEEKLRKQGFL
ncbi:MAG: tRNA (adenosine(37)-N6)-dimethylallyltransferase MiaA [Clostridia bacterium]|nr:tRNA (adenosine(37)-N6)-dimethylallyltransferase MiaA [Clostridia bacterium]